jgi:phage tail-like protein
MGRALHRGISHVSALGRATEVVEHREGGDPSTSRKWPGRTQYEAITLERGVTQDTDFGQWANKVWQLGAGLGSEVSLADFRKDVILDFYNEAGQLVLAIAAGRRSTRRCRRSTPTARRSPSSRSCSRTRAGNAMPR